MYRPRVISLEGNIGAGKSTLLETMKEKFGGRKDIIFVEEPVGIWESVKQDGLNMLQLFYKDNTRYAFAFQILACTTRLQCLKAAIKQAEKSPFTVNTIIMERSLDADRHIFAKALFENNQMESCEYDIYKRLSDDILREYSVDGIVWINTPPDECKNRIIKRARVGEEDIPLSYLQKCHENHIEWLGEADFGFVHVIEDTQSEEMWEPFLSYIGLQ